MCAKPGEDNGGGCTERFLSASDEPDGGGDGGWRGEALAVIEDIKPFVGFIQISSKLPCDESGVYINLETKEANKYTIELSMAGFRVSGQPFDCLETAVEEDGEKFFETPYALLDKISPGYRESFSGALADKLNALLPQST